VPGDAAGKVRAVLEALADLAPSAEERNDVRLSVRLDWFRWLRAEDSLVMIPQADIQGSTATSTVAVNIDRRLAERLAAVDRVRSGERSLRVGWLFVAGRIAQPDGRQRRVFHPLVTVPVRVARNPLSSGLFAVGDSEVTDLVADVATRNEYESRIEIGGGGLVGVKDPVVPAALLARLPRLHSYALGLAEAAGLPAKRVVVADRSPESFMQSDELVVVVGLGVYSQHDVGGITRAGTLRAMADLKHLDRWTALHSLYLGAPPASSSGSSSDGGRSVWESEHRRYTAAGDSPLLLTPAQRAAVERSRTEAVTLISGAPGTGKSHTIAAIACDALLRRERVLVAAKTDATIDALLDLLEDAPGVEPVVFGSNERREALATRLAAGQLRPASDAHLISVRRRLEVAMADRAKRLGELESLLEREARGPADDAEVLSGRLATPRLFEPGTPLDEAIRLAGVAAGPTGGWWSRRKARKAHRALVTLAGADAGADARQLASAVEVARRARGWAELVAAGGLHIGGAWDRFRQLDDEVRRLSAEWLAGESRSATRLSSGSLAAVAALATALRSGRAARRAQLAGIDEGDLLTGLPLWAGTLADIDDLLPPRPGLFDLVILDEASSIDQPLAVPALLRGQRAVIVGDPRQLRHVSFVSDERTQQVLATHGLAGTPEGARLDVRRNSLFDLAAGVAPVTVLTEHFRSDPHLVEFVARRLYGGQLQVATRTPRTQDVDCVDVTHLDGKRNNKGVVEAEVDHVVERLRELRAEGARSVGVVTPFRAQADALEEAVLKAFTADDIEALDVRVGTVHAFQGNERDLVIASLGLGAGDSAGSWRFVDDPHLFAVFVTRARRRMEVVVSADPPAGGLTAEYLAQADAPPGAPSPAGPVNGWTAELVADLERAGLAASTAYPTGRHVVDVCLANPVQLVALECGVHPAGPAAHIDRHLALRRSGWEIVEAYPSRWSERPGELVVELARSLGKI
jgi:hypothetical protein